MRVDSFEALVIFFACAAIAMVVFGCAASPDTFINVDKSINIEYVDDVTFDYESNSEIKSDAKLDGTVSPTTTTTVTPGF